MELHTDDDDDASEEDEEDSADDTDTDDSNYGAYSVATKDDYVPVQVKNKKKTKGGKMGDIESEPSIATANGVGGEDKWGQKEQKSLEQALAQFPKGTAERWDRIASKVPGKSKTECMLRVRYLAEMVKKKKQQQEQQDSCDVAAAAAEAASA